MYEGEGTVGLAAFACSLACNSTLLLVASQLHTGTRLEQSGGARLAFTCTVPVSALFVAAGNLFFNDFSKYNAHDRMKNWDSQFHRLQALPHVRSCLHSEQPVATGCGSLCKAWLSPAGPFTFMGRLVSKGGRLTGRGSQAPA